MRRLAALLALALVLAACDSAVGPITSGPVTRASDVPLPTRVGQASSQPGDPNIAAATGPWRRVPFPADPGFTAAQEAGCRNGPVAIGSSAARVVTDVRGGGRILLVFVATTKAYLCVASFDDPAHPVDVETLAVPSTALAPDGIDLVFYTEVGSGASTIAYAVGRVGPEPKAVIAGFVDQTFVFGATGGGWYSMWWPVTIACDGISAVNQAHIVLDNAPAPCEGTRGPSPST
jgi:hypothetical protein